MGIFRSDEDTLLEAVGRGCHDAFAILYDRMLASVRSVAYRVLGNTALSDEIAQEVLLAVWTGSGSFNRSRGSARTWILTIAHRRAVDAVRSEQSSRERCLRVVAGSAERPFDEVVEAVLDRSEHARIRDALGGLSALQRQAIELAYYHGCTHREIAEILGVPLGTAKTRLADGLRRLRRDLYADEGPGSAGAPGAPHGHRLRGARRGVVARAEGPAGKPAGPSVPRLQPV